MTGFANFGKMSLQMFELIRGIPVLINIAVCVFVV